MKILNAQSLASTVEAANDAYFLGQPPSKAQRIKVAQWIAARQGKPGSYANMFAPTKRDMRQGIRLFTGEKITTKAASSHILGQEACRAMILLNANTKDTAQALEAATSGMQLRLHQEKRLGMYCCGKCSVALWRHLLVGGLSEIDSERFLAAGLAKLKTCRDGKGRWRVFPFHYTLLALAEIDLRAANGELQYAAASLERSLKRPLANKYDNRRRILAERVLARS